MQVVQQELLVQQAIIVLHKMEIWVNYVLKVIIVQQEAQIM